MFTIHTSASVVPVEGHGLPSSFHLFRGNELRFRLCLGFTFTLGT